MYVYKFYWTVAVLQSEDEIWVFVIPKFISVVHCSVYTQILQETQSHRPLKERQRRD